MFTRTKNWIKHWHTVCWGGVKSNKIHDLSNNYRGNGGNFVDSELGQIPLGWQVGSLLDVMVHVKQSINPSQNPSDTFNHYSLPAFDVARIPSTELGGSILSNKYAVKDYSILVSKLNPRIPRIWPILLTEGNAVCSTEFQVMLPKSKAQFGFVAALLLSNIVQDSMVANASGTSGSHQRVNPRDILGIRIKIAPASVREAFHQVVMPLFEKMERNTLQSRTLAALRDTLLPQLLSGRLTVRQAELLVA